MLAGLEELVSYPKASDAGMPRSGSVARDRLRAKIPEKMKARRR
jgi:hypothetical protein